MEVIFSMSNESESLGSRGSFLHSTKTQTTINMYGIEQPSNHIMTAQKTCSMVLHLTTSSNTHTHIHISLSKPIYFHASQPSDVIYQKKEKYFLSDMILLYFFFFRWLECPERYLMWLINAANDI